RWRRRHYNAGRTSIRTSSLLRRWPASGATRMPASTWPTPGTASGRRAAGRRLPPGRLVPGALRPRRHRFLLGKTVGELLDALSALEKKSLDLADRPAVRAGPTRHAVAGDEGPVQGLVRGKTDYHRLPLFPPTTTLLCSVSLRNAGSCK